MDSYSKLYSDIVTSSIWSEDDKTRIVWITILALRDVTGYVPAALPGLANAARVSIAECEAAVAKLEAPDQYSRTPDYDGRRIKKVEGGWIVLNHQKFRERGTSDMQKERIRQRVRRFREKHKSDVTPCNAPCNGKTQCNDIKTNTNTNTNKEEEKRTPPASVRAPAFKKPIPCEVTEYAKSKGISLDGNVFCSYYESNGWKVGRNPMKSWKAAVTGTWRSGTSNTGQYGTKPAIRKPNANDRKQEHDRAVWMICRSLHEIKANALNPDDIHDALQALKDKYRDMPNAMKEALEIVQ